MKRKILIFIWFLILNSSVVYAQEDKGAITLEPITVTASRTAKPASQAPCGVSIISKKEVENSGAKDIPGLLKNIEGIYVYDASGTGTSGRVNMRGFWGGMSTHQLVLVDGVPQNSASDKLVDWNLISLDNVERIEVVKGGASALYGENAMAGVINIITKKPSYSPEVKVLSSYGSFNTSSQKLFTSAGSGNLKGAFSASRKSTEGFRRHSDYDDLHLNGRLNWDLGEDNLGLSLGYCKSRRGAESWALTEAQINEDRRQARPGTENDKAENKKLDLSLTYTKEFENSSRIKSIFYARDTRGSSFGSSGSSTKEYLDNEGTCGLILQYDLAPEIFGLKNFLTLGVDLERNEFDYQKYSAAGQARGAIDSDYDVDRKKIGPFIQDEIELAEPLSITLGLRYDLVKLDFKNHLDYGLSEKEDLSDISPKFGAVYRYGDSSSIYGNYSHAFRTPTLGQMFTYSRANTELDPEEAVNYELGVRHEFSSFLRGNLSLFYTDLDNEIVYDRAATEYRNYGRTSHSGAEARLEYQPFEKLKTFVNYAYLRAKDEAGEDGNYLASIPGHTANLGFNWDIGAGFSFEPVLRYTGSSYLDAANTAKLKSSTVTDVKISYKRDMWSAFLSIDNIFDKKYNSYGFISSGVKSFSPAANRTFTLGLGAEF